MFRRRWRLQSDGHYVQREYDSQNHHHCDGYSLWRVGCLCSLILFQARAGSGENDKCPFDSIRFLHCKLLNSLLLLAFKIRLLDMHGIESNFNKILASDTTSSLVEDESHADLLANPQISSTLSMSVRGQNRSESANHDDHSGDA